MSSRLRTDHFLLSRYRKLSFTTSTRSKSYRDTLLFLEKLVTIQMSTSLTSRENSSCQLTTTIVSTWPQLTSLLRMEVRPLCKREPSQKAWMQKKETKWVMAKTNKKSKKKLKTKMAK